MAELQRAGVMNGYGSFGNKSKDFDVADKLLILINTRPIILARFLNVLLVSMISNVSHAVNTQNR